MEHTWIFFALGGLLTSWLGAFVKKLTLAKGRDKDVFILTSFLLYVPFFTINMLIRWEHDFNSQILLGGFLIWILNFLIPLWSMTAFKYLNISFALVSMRLISSFLLLLVGIVFIGEQLSLYNYFGFVLGIIAIILFSGFKLSNKADIHWKGIVWVIMVIIATVGGHTGFKYILPEVNVHDYFFIQFSVAFLCILLYMTLRRQFKKVNIREIKGCFPFAATNLFLYALMFLYFIPNLYTFWPLSLGYKMLSYSLIVPIILSVIFLWEPINKTRIFAFGLTIVSIFLFLV